jgi:hypothetical protein
MAFAVERNVDAIRVAVNRLQNVARLIAFARIIVENTSEGTSQAPGPIPMLKNAKYRPRANTPNPAFTEDPRKFKATNIRAMAIPVAINKMVVQ